MADESLRDRVDGWFSLESPVTYWSFWAGLLRTVPVVLLAGLVVYAVHGERMAVVAVSPTPFVFAAATLGFAVRDLDGVGVVVSVVFGVVYGALLSIVGLADVLLTTLSPLLWVFAGLTFVGGIAGFLAPRLHRGDAGPTLREAQRMQGRK